jgi:hypothetical protein
VGGPARFSSQFLEWSCGKLAAAGPRARLWIWDTASWHSSQKVRTWIREHTRAGKQAGQQAGQGVRIGRCRLPRKSPGLNPIQPKWAHGKRRGIAPARLLSAAELSDRVCAGFGCPHAPHLAIAADAA